jgi:hypothetical protein
VSASKPSGDSERARLPVSPAPLALVHATVIDATGAPARPDITIVVERGRIAQLGRSGSTAVPDGATVVDATGTFVIPGLWDMHVHLGSNELLLPLYIARGVTGVRSMNDSVAVVRRFREQIARGELVGPRILITAGKLIDGVPPSRQGTPTATTAAEGRRAVATLTAEGSELIKVYEMLPRAAFLGIAEEANQRGIRFLGHVPMAVSAAEASDVGQRSMEHLVGVPLACSSNESQLRAEVVAAMADPQSPWPAIRAYYRADRAAYDSYDQHKAARLFQHFVKNQTWQVPTLITARALMQDRTSLASDARLRYMPSNLVDYWTSSMRATPFTLTRKVEGEREFQHALDLVRAMHRAGVPMLAGTDAPVALCFPGFALHDELALLVEAGFTPMEALQAATREAARFLDLLDSHGTIEVGKVADLVVLDANPLDDILNTQALHAVVVAGKLLTKNTLGELLDASSHPRAPAAP